MRLAHYFRAFFCISPASLVMTVFALISLAAPASALETAPAESMSPPAVVESVDAAVQADAAQVGTEQQVDAADPRVEAVAKRAQARWAALIAGDFAAAYGFETPITRDTMTEAHFRSQFGGAVVWRGVDVSRVRLSADGQLADVDLRIEYEAADPIGGTYSNRRYLEERWVWSDGEWWHARN